MKMTKQEIIEDRIRNRRQPGNPMGKPILVECKNCTQRFLRISFRGRDPNYCSNQCKQQAYRIRVYAAAVAKKEGTTNES